MRRLVYKKISNGPITEFNPSFKYHWTNQVFEDGKWKYVNRYIGKFGAKPIVWFGSKEIAEKCGPKDYDVADSIEWDGKDEEGYKNMCMPPNE